VANGFVGHLFNILGKSFMGQSYKDLVVWNKAMELVMGIYRLTQEFPKEEIFGLVSQLRRSSVSIPSNIAEGQGRLSKGEFRNFLGNARGSLSELETQILIAQKLDYLKESDAAVILDLAAEVGRILNGLIASTKKPKTERLTTSH
jgi:four helix bundle protein